MDPHEFARADPRAGRPLDIRAFGASPDNDDNAEAINYALRVGKVQRQPVLVPAGCFRYGDVLEVEDTMLIGEGDESALYSTNTDRASVYVRGTDVGVRKLRLTGEKATVRTSNPESRRILVREGTVGFVVSNVLIDSGSGSSLFMDGASEGHVIRNRFMGTLADSIHMSDKSHHILVMGNVIRNSGDDGIACVSYRDQGGLVHHITARFNDIRDNKHGRGMTVVGGSDVLYEDNYISSNYEAAGMLVAQEDSYNTFACKNVVYRRNTVRNCGSIDVDHTGIYVSSNSERHENILIERNNVCFDDGFDNCGGIRVSDPEIDVVLDQNIVANGDPPYRINFPDVVRLIEYIDGPVGMR